MARSNQIVDILKRELRAQGINYRQLATQLELSESTIKHMFSTKNFSLKRLDTICELLGLELTDLVEKFTATETKIDQLSVENEKLLISELPLLTVAYCITNRWSVEEILQTYKISEPECVRCLATLDRMKMIELQPGNKVRLIISNNFKWQPNGPIEKFFRNEVQEDFFDASFNGQDKLYMAKLGDLSDKSISQLIDRLENIGEFCDELLKEDKKQPFGQRHGSGMVLAIRKWGFSAFNSLRR
jgi:DNA-binding Xre family transcriptional regulator